MVLDRRPQVPAGSPPNRLDYTIDKDKLIVTHTVQRRDPETGALIDGPQTIDTFDFTGVPNGELGSVETILPVIPILAGKKSNGILTLTVLDWDRSHG